MFKKLDKYMDDLKSPYWEFYIYIVAIIFLIVGTITIFFGDHGLGQKFANFGSFLCGVIALIALIYARHEYLRQRGLNERVGIITNSLPKVKGFLGSNFVMISSNYHSITSGFKDSKTGVFSNHLEECELEDIAIENQRLIEELSNIWSEYKAQHMRAMEAGAHLSINYLISYDEVKTLIEALQDVLFFISKKLKYSTYRSRELELLEKRLADNLYYKKYIQNRFNIWDGLDLVEYNDTKAELHIVVDKTIATLKL